MDIASIFGHPFAPLVVLSLSFVGISAYLETKPHVIALGVFCILLSFASRDTSPDQRIVGEYERMRGENEQLKQNLMQVYSMVQSQKQQAPTPPGPPAPMPPSLSVPPPRQTPSADAHANEEDEGKPYI